MVSLTVVFGLAGVAGAVASSLIAVLPMGLEWFYDRRNRPLKVTVVRAFTKVNPTTGGRVLIRIDNRVRSAIPVQYSPMTECETLQGADGQLTTRGRLFENPVARLHPSNREWSNEPIPGHDSRELELSFPVREGVIEGRESVKPIIFANRFHAQEIRLGPFEFEVSPRFN